MRRSLTTISRVGLLVGLLLQSVAWVRESTQPFAPVRTSPVTFQEIDTVAP